MVPTQARPLRWDDDMMTRTSLRHAIAPSRGDLAQGGHRLRPPRIARMALRNASPYIADMAPRVRPVAAPAKSPVDESAAARERVRLGKWLDDQPDTVKVGLD